jgi:hypothetical protein
VREVRGRRVREVGMKKGWTEESKVRRNESRKEVRNE